jgi:hypothetical protein
LPADGDRRRAAPHAADRYARRSLVLAFILGALAQRFRISPLVGYLLAGILAGPRTPGFVADPALAADLAEIGVILLMFGVGLHFSLADLLSVRFIAVPGALVQIAFATALGMDRPGASAGTSAETSSSASRFRSPALWSYYVRCRSGVWSRPNRDASRSAGSSSRISQWC